MSVLEQIEGLVSDSTTQPRITSSFPGLSEYQLGELRAAANLRRGVPAIVMVVAIRTMIEESGMTEFRRGYADRIGREFTQ